MRVAETFYGLPRKLENAGEHRSAGHAAGPRPIVQRLVIVQGQCHIGFLAGKLRKSIRRSTLGKPTLKQILDALKNQVLVGRSYLDLAKGLVKADPVILQTASTFFGLTM